MKSQIASGVPWGVIGTDGKEATLPYWWGADTPVQSLTERTFHHGITDCYSLIRDFYRVELGITLPEYPRSWDWWVKRDGEQKNLYLEGFSSAGFTPIALHASGSTEFLGLAREPQRGDMWFTQIHSKVPNHAGIYLGNGLCLHHLSGRKPIDVTRMVREEPIYRWANHITHWFRHEDLL